jgi:hypothetical protein
VCDGPRKRGVVRRGVGAMRGASGVCVDTIFEEGPV